MGNMFDGFIETLAGAGIGALSGATVAAKFLPWFLVPVGGIVGAVIGAYAGMAWGMR